MKDNQKTITMSVVLSLFFSTISPAEPPKITRMTPPNGAANVNPRLKQIGFVFDQKMTTGKNYSVCGGGANYPESTGQPRWVNDRTFVMNVKLKGNHNYEFSLNCPSSYQGFRNINGEPLEFTVVKFSTAGGRGTSETQRVSPTQNVEAIKRLRKAIEDNYSYRDIRKVDWDKLFAEKQNQLRNAPSAERFATVAGELLAAAEDKHIWLTVGDQHFNSYVKPVTANMNFLLLEKIVPNWQQLSRSVYMGRFEDGIGYILINSWNRQDTEPLMQVYAALWEFSEAPGLIIDVRNNGGGAEPLAQEFAGCFIDKPVIYAKHVYRDVGAPGGFTSPHERKIEPNKLRPKYRGKVAVLTGPVVMSSCEAFLLMMKQVPGCKLVGEKSQGSSGNPKPIELGNGVTVYLPSWKSMRPDGTFFETEGIAADIEVKTTQAELQRKDAVIEAALKFLRED